MTKMEKFYNNLTDNDLKIAPNGDTGYIITLGELLENNGKNEFFRIVRNSKKYGFTVSRDVFTEPFYERADKKWYAECYTDICYNSPAMDKNTKIFIGFDF